MATIQEAIKEAYLSHRSKDEQEAIMALDADVSRVQNKEEIVILHVQKWDEAAQYYEDEPKGIYPKACFAALQAIAQKAGIDVPRYVNQPIEAGTINWGKVHGALGIRGPLPPAGPGVTREA